MAEIEIPNYSDEDQEKVDIKAINKQMNEGCSLTGTTGWGELFLKDQLKRAIREAGFEKPSHVQVQGLPHALQNKDLICQAKSGMGKTAVFIITILQCLSKNNGYYLPGSALILVHTRQLAHQIFTEFHRMKKYFQSPEIETACFFGGIKIDENIDEIYNSNKNIHIVIGTPGRLVELTKKRYLNLSKVQFFVIDECDNILKNKSMRQDFITLFNQTPLEKQVMMLSATLSEADKKDAKNFMRNPAEVYVDEGALSLEGLKQYYVQIEEVKKVRRLLQLLDTLPFNQAIIFANKVKRVERLANLLHSKMFNPFQIHSRLSQQDRILTYDAFKRNERKILVATDLFGRGIDIDRVNLVINFDFPYDRQTYLHRVGRAGRFNTKGVAINFINPDPTNYPYERVQPELQVLEEVQKSLQIKIEVLPAVMDISTLQ